jgi:rare lipoprotein A
VKRFATATLPVLGCLGALLAPPAAWAGDDEAYGGTPAGGSGSAGGALPEPVPADDARGLNAGPGALLGRAQRASGTMPGAGSERTVLLQLGDGFSGWVTIAQARTGAGGTFRAVWRANRTGRYTLRAVLSRDGQADTSARGGALTAPVTVYEPGVATVFGPGFYGRRTACRSVLTPATVGVAHRSLPCGARVEVYYGGRRLLLPVVDRGPYVAGVAWDLTTAAARALRFPGKAWVGTIGIRPYARG